MLPTALRTTLTAALFSCLLASAQTPAEQLQSGMFAEQTQGDLDKAITIYRQLANSGLPQRDVAAQAQYRLALALLQKGDLTGASVEMQRLAQNYADYRTLISGLAARASHAGIPAPAVAPAPLALPSQTAFDHGSPVSATGKIIQVLWVNPVSYVTVDAGGGQFYTFATGSPNSLTKQQIDRNTFKADAMVSVIGNLAESGEKRPFSIVSATGQKTEGSAALARANVIVTLADGKTAFDRQKLPPPGTQPPPIPNGTIFVPNGTVFAPAEKK